jgi:Cys-tRNA synthase (O-phospho-L-seryl-tRNA:Cys-tRNA synthase)
MSSVLKSIQDAIKKENEPAAKLVELNLTDVKIGKFTPDIKKAIEECKNLEILILTNCGL